MKQTFLFVLIIVLKIPSFSQIGFANDGLTFSPAGARVYRPLQGQEEADTSQLISERYLNYSFKEGLIYLDGKQKFATKMRYNILDDFIEIESLDEQEDIVQIIMAPNVSVKIDELMLMSIPDIGIINIIYQNGDFFLCEKHQLEFIPEYIPSDSYGSPKPAYLKRLNPNYYIYENGRKPENVISFKKSEDKEVRAFLKENKNKLKSTADMIQLVKFMVESKP